MDLPATWCVYVQRVKLFSEIIEDNPVGHLVSTASQALSETVYRNKRYHSTRTIECIVQTVLSLSKGRLLELLNFGFQVREFRELSHCHTESQHEST